MKKGLIPRILITLLGIGLIFMGASQAILSFAGKSELQPGDLIFWSKLSCHCGRWQEIHHAGIYIGDGKTVEASSSKGRVVINNLWGENGATWRIHSYARPYV